MFALVTASAPFAPERLRRATLRPFALLLGALIGLSACGPAAKSAKSCTSRAECASTEACTAGHCASANTGAARACARDEECLPEEYCLGGVCVGRTLATTKPQCTKHTECPGRFCKATGVCVDCLNPRDCASGLICRADGTCGHAQSGCRDDAGCAGLKCSSDGVCVQCLTADQCKPGESCRRGACYAPTPPATACTTPADCATLNKVCDVASSLCVDCKANEECGADHFCAAGTCEPNPSPVLPPGGCTSRAECGGLACFANVCQPCVWDTMCADPADNGVVIKICDWTSGQCIDPQCKNAYDCPAADGCYDAGHCGPCWVDSECRTAEMCDWNTASCVARPCIGSGTGEPYDCPLGYACVDVDAGPLDGLSRCVAAAQLPASAAGQPFTQVPGTSCASGNACQTSVCDASVCRRACLADRDCKAGEVCWAEWDPDAPNGHHFCYRADPANYLANGAACTWGFACDSGLCNGRCSDGTLCNDSADCASGLCHGTCAAHCRASVDCTPSEVCTLWPVHTRQSPNSGFVPICSAANGAGTKADGAACTGATECRGALCVANVCTALCGADEDCQGGLAGLRCTPVGIVDAAGQPAHSAAVCQ